MRENEFVTLGELVSVLRKKSGLSQSTLSGELQKLAKGRATTTPSTTWLNKLEKGRFKKEIDHTLRQILIEYFPDDFSSVLESLPVHRDSSFQEHYGDAPITPFIELIDDLPDDVTIHIHPPSKGMQAVDSSSLLAVFAMFVSTKTKSNIYVFHDSVKEVAEKDILDFTSRLVVVLLLAINRYMQTEDCGNRFLIEDDLCLLSLNDHIMPSLDQAIKAIELSIQVDVPDIIEDVFDIVNSVFVHMVVKNKMLRTKFSALTNIMIHQGSSKSGWAFSKNNLPQRDDEIANSMIDWNKENGKNFKKFEMNNHLEEIKSNIYSVIGRLA